MKYTGIGSVRNPNGKMRKFLVNGTRHVKEVVAYDRAMANEMVLDKMGVDVEVKTPHFFEEIMTIAYETGNVIPVELAMELGEYVKEQRASAAVNGLDR